MDEQEINKWLTIARDVQTGHFAPHVFRAGSSWLDRIDTLGQALEKVCEANAQAAEIEDKNRELEAEHADMENEVEELKGEIVELKAELKEAKG